MAVDDQQPPEKPAEKSTFEGTRFEDTELQRVHSQLLREKSEPTENFGTVPLFLVFLCMILAFVGGIYLIHYDGDYSAFHFDESKEAGIIASDGPREIDMMALGGRVYAQQCQICHQANGLGQAGNFPPLVASEWVSDNPRMLTKIVLGGLQGPIVVKGNSYNNVMTAFGQALNDQQIAAVLTYIRTDPAFENNSYEVSPELVAEVRANYGGRAEAWTADELVAIHGEITGNWQPESSGEPAPDAEGQGQAEPETVPAADEA